MKKIFVLPLVYLLFASAGYTQSDTAMSAKQKAKLEKKAPVITFETLVYNFDTIPKGGNGTYEFVFKNTGKSPLIINNCRSS